MVTLNVIFVLLNQGLLSLMPRALIITRLPCPFETFHYINGAVDYTAFSVWLISFRIMFMCQDAIPLCSLITLHYLKLLKNKKFGEMAQG